MQHFRYLARNTAGEKVKGYVEGETRREALDELARRNLLTVVIEPVRRNDLFPLVSRRVSNRRLTTLYRQLVDLLRSGVPLARALQVIARQTSDEQLQRIVKDMAERLANGESLSEAMSEHQEVFGDLAISMVRAGEEGGFIETVLEQVCEFTRRQQQLRSRISGALAYPLFLLVVTFLVVTVMMVVFVPNFAPIFDRMRESGDLPWLTETVLATSEALQSQWLFLFVGFLVVSAVVIAWGRSESGRRAIDRFKLWMPGLKDFWGGFAVARFTRIFGTMLGGGVPILSALRISKDSAGNQVFAEAIDRAADSLEHGDGLAIPLKESGVFPDDVNEMIAVGEESNNLQGVLISIADSTEARLAEKTDILLRLLEPALLLVMAVITLIIVTALLLPVFSMGQMI